MGRHFVQARLNIERMQGLIEGGGVGDRIVLFRLATRYMVPVVVSIAGVPVIPISGTRSPQLTSPLETGLIT